MVADPVLSTVALTVVAGTACQAIARWMKVPAILPLLIGGVVLGPDVLNLVRPDELGEGKRVLVGLAVAVILFEGGLSLKTKAFQFSGTVIRNLVTFGSLVTWGLAALTAYLLFPALGVGPAVLFGSLVIVTGPTVIQPLLKSVRPRRRLADILRGEAILIDPVGALCAVLVLEFLLEAASHGTTGVVLAFFGRVGLGVALGGGGAFIVDRLIRQRDWIPRDLRNLFVLSSAIGLYSASELIASESGVLTVTLAGFLLGWLHPPGIDEIEEFKGHVTVLMVSMVFVLLSADLSLVGMRDLGWSGLTLVAVIVFIVRPATIFLCTRGSELSLREKLFLSWIAPRGIVAAAVSSLFALLMERNGMSEGREVMSMTFAVIVGTVMIQAPTARLVGRKLGVLESKRNGVLIVGANSVGRALGRKLSRAGVPVLMLDTNRWNVKKAQNDGLDARVGNALDELVMRTLDLDVIGRLMAVTSNDSVNRVAVQIYEREFGLQHVHAIRLADSPEPSQEAESAPYLFGRRLSWEDLFQRLGADHTLESAAIEEKTTTVEELMERYPGVVPLFAFGEDSELRPLADDGPLTVGESVIYLNDPSVAESEPEADEAEGAEALLDPASS
jgi:NhaP-type Na+/H+ or K+/H+ antiporter